MWTDLGVFWSMARRGTYQVCCVNRAGLVYPCEFDFWVSWHVDWLLEYAKQRLTEASLWSCRESDGVNWARIPQTKGSSGMVAVQLAIHQWQCEKIVLAGIPLDGRYEEYLTHWHGVAEQHGSKIRSMSGNTERLFGKPDVEFLK